MKKNRRNNSRPAAIATAKDTTKAIETRAGVLKEACLLYTSPSPRD